MPVPSKWRHGATHVYDKNYQFGINYYQPMIDYMDKRNSGSSTKSHYPHLPFSDERLLWEDKPVQPYAKEDLARLAIDAEMQAKEHLNTFKVKTIVGAGYLTGWLETAGGDLTSSVLNSSRPSMQLRVFDYPIVFDDLC